MKKLVLLLAVAFSVSMFSCGSDAKTEAAAADTVAPAEECCDTCAAADTCVADTCVADSVVEAPAAE